MSPVLGKPREAKNVLVKDAGRRNRSRLMGSSKLSSKQRSQYLLDPRQIGTCQSLTSTGSM